MCHNHWVLSRPMFAWSKITHSPPWPSNAFLAYTVLYKSSLFVFCQYPFVCDISLFEFNLRTHHWILHKTKTPPPWRIGHFLVVKGDSMILFGGSGDYNVLNDTWELSFETLMWKEIKAKTAPSPRWYHRGVCYNDVIYIFGGSYGHTNFDDTYKLEKNEWKLIEVKHKPCKRRAHQCVLYDHSMWVFGGKSDRGNCFDIWKFDLKNQKWTEIEYLKRSNFEIAVKNSIVVYERKFYLFGGVTDYICLNQLLEFDGSVVGPVRVSGEVAGRRGRKAIVYEDTMIIFGGKDCEDEMLLLDFKPKLGKRAFEALCKREFLDITLNFLW